MHRAYPGTAQRHTPNEGRQEERKGEAKEGRSDMTKDELAEEISRRS
jgi:hypothetical protein